MASLELSDLHNPDHIKAIMLKNGNFVPAEPSQGFHIREKSTTPPKPLTRLWARVCENTHKLSG